MTSILGLGVRPVTATTPPPPPNGCSTTTTIDSTDPALPIAITDNATFTSTITVSGLNPVLWDVDLETSIRHMASGHLQIFLISPAGTRVTLTTNNGGNLDDVFDRTVWDDDAGDVNGPGPITDNQLLNNVTETPVVPEEALGAFIGEDPNGVWTLEIRDTLAGQTGELEDWSLILTTLPEAPVNQTTNLESDDLNLPITIFDNGALFSSTLTVAGLDSLLCDIDLTTFITISNSGDLDISLTSPAGTQVTITTDNGGFLDNLYNGTVWDDDGGDTNGPGPITDNDLTNNVTETPVVPEEALGAFIGEDPNGTWTLTATDIRPGDGDFGVLADWSLDLTTCELDDNDGDGVADGCDPCPFDNPDDTDGDGVCDSNDICPDGDDNIDADADGVPDFCDVCPGGDDNVDGDGDGVADFCDPCPLDNPDDTDGDGVCDSNDICPGGDDNIDTDADGVPDFCDVCAGGDDNVDGDGDGVADFCDPCPADNPDDSDGDGVCDSDDVCDGGDDTVDSDGDGEPDACDDTPTGQEVPGDECCGTGTMMMTPLTMVGWSWMRRRKHRSRMQR